MKTPTQLLSVQLMTALLVACGGGASDSEPSQGNSNQTTTESALANYQVSGHIIVKHATRHDSDINDPNATFLQNNSFASAQAIFGAATLGGHVNVAGEGEEGQTFYSGDEVDIYSVSLSEYQEVFLSFDTEAGANDIDLYLYSVDDLDNPVAISTGTSSTESLRAPADGDYFIKVEARRGASAYSLSLEGGLGASAVTPVSMEFVPGEVIIKYKSRAYRSFAVGDRSDSLPTTVSVDQLLAEYPELQSENDISVRSLLGSSDEALAKQQTLKVVKALQARDDIEFVEPNYLYHVSALPSDPGVSSQPHYNLINLQEAWDLETGSADVIVAVIDTGIALGHPDLENKLVPGYDFVSNAATSGDGDGIDSNPDDPGDPTSAIAYHGTHVAGTIAAEANNGQGGVGVAWGVKIMPLRALTYQSGSSLDVAQAILYAAGLPNRSGRVPERRADVINMSLGGTANSTTIANAIRDARAAGCIVVAAAGNSGSSAPNYPAANEGVISVSAVNANKDLTYYSNYGTTIDVAAPGGESGDLDGDGRSDSIYSTIKDSSGRYTYGYMNGTSMATPHVAGVLALMRSANPGITPEEIDALIASGQLTSDLGPAGRDNQFGYGLIDAAKAVRAVGIAERVNVSSSNLNLGLLDHQQTLQVSGGGTDTGFISAQVTQSWLTVQPTSIDALGRGSYLVQVDRSSLADGTYGADVQFLNAASEVVATTRVTILVSDVDPDADAGTEYVFLKNATSSEIVGPVMAELNQGVYSFNFSSVPEGTYYLLAGSDEDNDYYVCGAGEACGAYPTVESPLTITVSSDIDGLDFVTEYSADSANLQSMSLFSLQRPELARY